MNFLKICIYSMKINKSLKIGWFSPILLSSLFYCLCWILLWISVHNIDKVVVKGAYKVLQWLIDFCQFVQDCLLIFRRDICHVFRTVLFMFVHCFSVNWLNSTINAYWNYESLLTREKPFFFFFFSFHYILPHSQSNPITSAYQYDELVYFLIEIHSRRL